jgi:hypothetical protein
MKNPFRIFCTVFRTTIKLIPLTDVVTPGSCYDHVNEDCCAINTGEHHEELQPLRIQETE